MDIYKLNSACTACGLCKVATKVCIPGRGTGYKPSILFVGQAPGETEDQQGRVFAGPAGELLEQAIEEYDLRPNYITNAVKCFPGKKLAGGGDNEPTKGQIEACRSYLEMEIETVEPKVIVCLGNTALRAVCGKSGITTWAGRVAGEYKGIPVFGMLHPSYILRSPGQLTRFESDCKSLRAFLHPEEKRSHPRVSECAPKDVMGTVRRMHPPIAFDFETTDKTFEGNRIRCFSFSDGKTSHWVDLEKHREEGLAVLLEFLKSPIPKAAQNVVFEGRWSLGLFGRLPSAVKYDTMLLAHLIDENGPKALDVLAAKYCDAPPWDISQDMEINGWTYATIPMEKLGPYNALDSLYTRCVLDKQLQGLPGPLLAAHNKVLLPMALQCAKFQHRGIKLDSKWTADVLARFKKQMAKRAASFKAQAEVVSFEKKLTEEKKKLNMNSPVQISRLFFKRMRLPVFERTAGGKPSAREPALMRIPNPPVSVKEYLAWKSDGTVCNNYLEKFPRFCDKKGLIHGDFNPARIVTGRIAVSDPPLTNIPDDSLVRGMLCSRWPGGKIASSDYKQLELYLVASESEDDAFLRAIRNKQDAHSDTAAAIWPREFVYPKDGKAHCEKCELYRAIAKRINFGIVYGVTEYKIAREFNIPIDEALHIINGFKKAHPKIFLWMRKVHFSATSKGYVETRFGRRRHFPGIKTASEKELAAMLREAGNFPIQSAGADITSTACLILEKNMRAAGLKSLLVHHNHDALMVDVHPNELPVVPPMLVSAMEKETQAKCPWLKVPLRVDVKVTTRWGGAEDPNG